MTIEELSVRITAEADDALETLDLVTERLDRLNALLGQQLHITLDTGGAGEGIAALEEQLRGLQERFFVQAEGFSQSLAGMLGGLSEAAGLLGGQGLVEQTASIQEQLSALADVAHQAGEAAGNAAGQTAELTRAGQAGARQAQSYRTALQGVSSRLEQLGRQRSAVSGMKELRSQLDRNGRSADDLKDRVTKAERALRDSAGSADLLGDCFHGMGESFGEAGSVIAVNAQSLYGQLGGVIAWANNASESLNISGSVNVETGGAIESLNQLISAALAAQNVLAGLGVVSGGAGSAAGVSGGGGGGGGGQSPEEEAEQAAEEARQEAIRRDYELIEHKRHMNEITLEEELSLLERMRSIHQMTAEEIMDWEERVYDVRQEIRRRDEESLNQLTQGVVDALTERYEAMRDAELNRLDESRRAWETWRDDSVRAIDEQIAALDRLAQAEEREDQDAEELRRIEKLRQDIAYEQDDYNRMKLEEQLAAAVQSREDRLRRQELEDRKAALEQEAELIQQQAEAELNRLDEEQAAVEAAYAQRLSQAALEAEAEQMILAGNQQAILELLNTYVPEYDQLGRTMGERLLEGFQNTVGNVVSWFEGLSQQLGQAQDGLIRSASQQVGYARSQVSGATGNTAGVSISQNVTFNQPVESPGDLVRRMESVNRALGEWMSQEG